MSVKVKIKTIKDRAESKPMEAIAGIFVVAGLFTVGYALISHSRSVPGAISNAYAELMRAGMLYAPEIISNAQYAAGFFASAMQGAEFYEMIKISCVAIGSAAFLKTVYDEVKACYCELDPAQRRKLGYGVVTMVTVGALLMAEGCISTDPVPEPVPTQTETPDLTPTEEPITGWWNEDKYSRSELGVLSADENLFGVDIEGVLNRDHLDGKSYSVYSKELGVDGKVQAIFVHMEAGAGTFESLRNDLSVEYYDVLKDMCGSPKEITLEHIDLDGDGKLDTTAVEYIGTKGVWGFKTEYNSWHVNTFIGAEIGKIIKSN